MRPVTKIAAACLALLLACAFGGVARAQVDVGYDLFGNFRNDNSNKCLDVRAEDGYFRIGARVQQYHCTGAQEQMWAAHFMFLYPGRSQFRVVQFKVKRSGMCLQPNAFLFDTFDDGLDLVQKPCDASNQLQLWSDFGWDGMRTAHHWVNYWTHKCIDVEEASTADHARVQQYTCNGTGAQLFRAKVDTSNP